MPVILQIFSDQAVDQVKVQPQNPGDPPPHFDPLLAPEWRAEWGDRPGTSTFIDPGQRQSLYLRITTCTGVADEWRRNFDAASNSLVDNICGMRKFTVQVQSLVAANEDGLSALYTLERLRTMLWSESSYGRLLAAGLVIVDMTPTMIVPSPFDKRGWSVGNMDVMFVGAFNITDPVPIGWIEKVRLSSQLLDGAQPHTVTDDVLPPA